MLFIPNVIAALRGLLEAPSMKELGTGVSFLPEVAAAVHNVPETDVVPLDYHERCMGLAIKRRIEAEKKQKLTEETNRKIIENYAPVVHGLWIGLVGMQPPEYQGRSRCSHCGRLAPEWRGREQLTEYCPRCGAKMDGGTEL